MEPAVEQNSTFFPVRFVFLLRKYFRERCLFSFLVRNCVVFIVSVVCWFEAFFIIGSLFRLVGRYLVGNTGSLLFLPFFSSDFVFFSLFVLFFGRNSCSVFVIKVACGYRGGAFSVHPPAHHGADQGVLPVLRPRTV